MKAIQRFFMNMMQSWRDDLVLLKPSELSAMAYIIARKVFLIFKNMMQFWWALILFIVIAWYFLKNTTIIFTVYSIFIVLLSRSSVPIKNNHYLFGSQKTVCAVYYSLVLGLLNSARIRFPNWIAASIGWDQQYIVLSPFIILSIWWALDAYLSPWDTISTKLNALKMFMYHYPFFIVVYGIFWCGIYPALQMISDAPLAHLGFALLLMPCYGITMVYGYTRFIRSEMGRYYEYA